MYGETSIEVFFCAFRLLLLLMLTQTPCHERFPSNTPASYAIHRHYFPFQQNLVLKIPH